MNKILSFFLQDVSLKTYLTTLKKFLIALVVSTLPGLVDGGIFYMPMILGAFIVYQFYEEKQRIKYLVYLLPFIFLFIFFTSGGAFIIMKGIADKDDLTMGIFTGTWASYVILITVWALFKVRLYLGYFVALTILIPIIYLAGLYDVEERYAIFFYIFYNLILALVLSAVFSQKNNDTIKDNENNLLAE